jgi:predicted ATPase
MTEPPSNRAIAAPADILPPDARPTAVAAAAQALAKKATIRTVAGRGYQFTGEIRPLSAATDEAPDVITVAPAASIQPPTNLPEQVTELIGREKELADILALLATHRFVNFTGPGGIGKTRLALTAARQLLPDFADGVWIAEFSAIADPGLVCTTVAAAVGLQFGVGEISPQLLSRALAHRRLLLILDTCEHVIDAAAAMAEALLQAGSDGRILATSREPLRAEGEQIYHVPSLALPATEAEDPWRFGAVRLFVVRSGAHGVPISDDQRVAAAIAGICRQLDGIPLAIELAAARATTLGIEGLGAHLDDRFGLLTGGRRTALPRHQTLRATLDWSHGLLSEPERVTLRRLAVFARAFSVAAASTVTAPPERAQSDIVDDLSRLVAKSLVTVEVKGSVARYRLLDTTRAYALEKLKDSGEHEPLLRRHADYYRDLFERAEVEWESRPIIEWLDDYVWCIDNLRAALDWAFSPGGDAKIGVALATAAVPLWMDLSLLDECRSRAEQALAVCDMGEGSDPRREMKLYAALATSCWWGSAGGHAQFVGRELSALWTKVLEIAESLGDAEYQLRALWGLCGCHTGGSGQCHVALEMAQRFCTLAAQQRRRTEELIGHRMIGFVQHLLGDQASARRHIEHMLANFRLSDQKFHEAKRFQLDQRVAACTVLARVLWAQGFPDEAVRTAKGAVDEAREINQTLSLCFTLGIAAGPVMLWVGDLAAAERYIAMLVDHSARHGLLSWGALGRTYQAVLATRRGDSGFGSRRSHGDLDESGRSNTAVMFLNALPVDFARAGKIAEGLAAAALAMERAEHTETHWLFPELLRTKVELLLLQDATGAVAAAEGHFRQALDWARRQGALSLELRAATSLARLLRDHVRIADAKAVLQSVYDRFTEGFDTADRQQLRQQHRNLAERRQRGMPGGDVGEVWRDRIMAEIQRSEALCSTLALTGTGKQPLDPHRHIAEQRAERHGGVALARQPAPAANATATALTHHSHLRRHDLTLKGRHELLRLGQPKPKVSHASLLIAFDAGHLGLRHLTRPQLRHQFHAPHQLRHHSQPHPVSTDPIPTKSAPPRILHALSPDRWHGGAEAGSDCPTDQASLMRC